MINLERIKDLLFRIAADVIRKTHLYNFFKFHDDSRPNAPFKLIFFCGKLGTEYLNASLFSIYHFWKFLPEIIIVSDGTPVSTIKHDLVNWPRKVEIITWEEAALNYKEKGKIELYNVAFKKRWPGKKFVSLLYLAEKFLILYSDTDVLWFSSPEEIDYLPIQPFIKMAKDIEPSYTRYILESLQEEQILFNTSFNSGTMYLNGNFSSYPKWKKLCQALETNPDTDNFAEQTAFAILNKHFGKEKLWSENEILIKIDDTYNLNYMKNIYSNLLARHYVSTKHITFWRDFIYMCIDKRSKLLKR